MKYMQRVIKCALILWVGCGVAYATAKTEDAKVDEAVVMTANPEDVKSIDAIVAALYDVISGPAGARDWDRFSSLYIKDAQLIARRHNGAGYVAMRPSDYVVRAGAQFEKAGFYEKEVSRKLERFGYIAHIFSTYESRHSPEEEAFDRGINSIQLMYDQDRWWVVNVFWQSASEEHPIPAEYQK